MPSPGIAAMRKVFPSGWSDQSTELPEWEAWHYCREGSRPSTWSTRTEEANRLSGISFEPVQPVRAYERVVEQVELALLRGELKAGERLPSERDLMKQLAVSRSTVREALRVLESHGVVRSRPGDPNGPVVLAFGPAPLRKSLQRLASGDGVSLSELLQFRLLLEGPSAFLAAELRTDADLAAMEKAITAMQESVDKGLDHFAGADVDFHDAMATASGNRMIRVCAEVVRGVALNLIIDKMKEDREPQELMNRWVARHEAVLDAIRRQDGRRASNLMQSDILEFYAPWLTDEEQAVLRRFIDGMSTSPSASAPDVHGNEVI
jgi:GntR family transcriptional regulator, transcriptional repressor for pyruvate dehydrogenase complex